MESSIQAILFYEPLQIAEFAASEIQELAIWAGGILIDGPMGQSKEVGLALFEAASKDGPSFVKTPGCRRNEGRRTKNLAPTPISSSKFAPRSFTCSASHAP